MNRFKRLRCAILVLLLAVLSGQLEGQVILMRHGQAEHNVQDVYNADPSQSNYKPSLLTSEGRLQTTASSLND